jgi:hypothetical protein
MILSCTCQFCLSHLLCIESTSVIIQFISPRFHTLNKSCCALFYVYYLPEVWSVFQWPHLYIHHNFLLTVVCWEKIIRVIYKFRTYAAFFCCSRKLIWMNCPCNELRRTTAKVQCKGNSAILESCVPFGREKLDQVTA